jgi:hypothetical protein
MDQLLRITLDAIGRVTSNHEYRLKALEAKTAKPESCASDCSADGRRIKQGEASVQPAGPEQTLEKLRAYMENELAEWQVGFRGDESDEEASQRQAIHEYKHMLGIIEGEAGVGQDDRSRPNANDHPSARVIVEFTNTPEGRSGASFCWWCRGDSTDR